MSRRFRKLLIVVVGLLAIAVLTLLTDLFGGFFGGGAGPGPGNRPDGAGEGVSGQVVSATGRPAAGGIRVTIQGAKNRRVELTDETGRFRFDSVPDGATAVEAALGPLRMKANLTPRPVTLRLPDTCAVGGRVVTASTAEPVNLAVVRCGGKVVQTGVRGMFRIEDVPLPDGRPPLVEVSAPNHVGLRFRPDLEGAWDDLYLKMRPR